MSSPTFITSITVTCSDFLSFSPCHLLCDILLCSRAQPLSWKLIYTRIANFPLNLSSICSQKSPLPPPLISLLSSCFYFSSESIVTLPKHHVSYFLLFGCLSFLIQGFKPILLSQSQSFSLSITLSAKCLKVQRQPQSGVASFSFLFQFHSTFSQLSLSDLTFTRKKIKDK